MLITNPPIHPGEILRVEFMQPLGLTAGRLAKALGVPRTRIERLMAEKTALTVDSALRLGRYFGTDAGFWLNLAVSYDASVAQGDADLARAVAAITPLAESHGAGLGRSG
ncbi:MAG: HigA family addiction module antitoxin [Cypionkella sp.]|nr:HigA family addiction module antitoxin [Cypionkella sp.]